ncbi:SMP-30/gluconolactonase/LRE family protein [Leptospira sp. 2 VSF19]|uniref:SMP-30/gluconolactonase/LRE family protein n=1 Tax=Leptospira soteropolitanensis TaxID=2950025 RepID=A0AAW5VFL5_9LEPT|nr:SMP-30/gluconolactonase/LRE family protein [Leptospira soteropolitanensis]MCW7491420.1 SMP-30/gluconolactonase/LRE family protein [Leptospira soteropolitanensis]MCW7499004.1 SMP-30/gluconolactonase/LRE family protein [Leptospira soteropolitanensis]MCW7521404.1 SMP-30/gluconolactonase/LRE family protein [Leptospira soteropolitanensis]MCW7525108.1 SMP-30/gluconolactonase/LRE family protein [Leptospira soteropolitanensis]MCW7528975.1 SMP-30/gluconolactonase/LRE family protein [Leptospira soter
MKVISLNSIILILLLFLSCNTSNIKIGKAYKLGEVPESVLKVSKPDPFLTHLNTNMEDLPGHDDLIFDNKDQIAFASGMDGWIWKLDFKTNTALAWVKPPVNPAGLQFSNKKNESILVCASKLGGVSYEETKQVGLYEVNIKSKKVVPLLLYLPKTDPSDFEIVYSEAKRPTFAIKTLNDSNARPFSLCNDLAVSEDGNRIYLSEPFERSDAAMGSGAVPEAIGLYPHGKLWMFDRKQNTISLIMSGFTFVDGIIIADHSNFKEESVIITETTKFRIIKANISGKKEGSFEVLLENLPGLADGLERDNQGRIWVGIIKPRSGLVNMIHNNPWLKPFLLSLPQRLLPIAKKTGILVLKPDGKTPLYYSMHDGSKIKDISVVVPNLDTLYFPSFDTSSRGLYSMPISSILLGESSND